MVRVEWFSESETSIMNKTEITAFILQNRATKAEALVEILTKDDAAAVLAVGLQLLPGGEDRERIVEALVPHSELTVIRDALAIHAPNWGGAAGREMGRLASQGDEVAQCVLLAIAKADDGNGVTLAECLRAGDETPLRKWERPIRTIRDSLAAANGGHSQYGSAQIAHAIRGHLNNGLLYGQEAELAELLREASLQEEAQWPDYVVAAEAHQEIAAAFKAADAAFAAAPAADSGT